MENKLISANAVRDLCGGVSDMTLWRWLNDPDLAFPKAVYIGKRRYFREAEISAWIEAQAETRPGNTLRLNAIAAPLGVPPEALFEAADLDGAILDALRLLSPEDKEMLARMVEALAAKAPKA